MRFDPIYLTQKTLDHYESTPTSFWEGTKDHDVSQNINALCGVLPDNRSLNILDFGCGPGRDLKNFKLLGHNVIGLDGCPTFCQMARDYSGCEVWQQNFINLELPADYFDGIFANASLFHVPKNLLLECLIKLNKSLKDQGALFSSNPRGNEEGLSGTRYGNYMQIEEYGQFLDQSGFEILNYYYRPSHLPIEEAPWLAVVAKKKMRFH